MTKHTALKQESPWRLIFVFLVIAALFAVVVWKIFDLQVVNNDFLQLQGDARTVRNDVIAAHRGIIMDRNGEPLAVSTPVTSLIINPKRFLQEKAQWQRLAPELEALGINGKILKNRIEQNPQREYLVIKRRMVPSEAQRVLDLNIAGVWGEEEYKRYYPLGEVAAHIVGLTDAQDTGQEGLELAYDAWLEGKPGSKLVLKDRLGGIIRDLKTNVVAQPGKNLEISIDSRIQFLAYKALKEEVLKRRASSGSAVVLDARTGEVLAMVNQPSYNPNNRANLSESALRNRAIVDLLEPGSTVKPFTITAALESGLFTTQSVIETSPGYIRVEKTNIKDPVNYGPVTLEKIITKSSQVGATKIGLSIGQDPILDVLARVGFGQAIGTGFPGESTGVLPNHEPWHDSELATLAYGYGFHASPLQLAQAYLVLANGGIAKPVSLLKIEAEVEGERVLSEEIAGQLVPMLETVVDKKKGGTAVRAAIPAYRVAGKTGTAWYYDVKKGGYDNENYVSLFAGFVPATAPRIVAVITIHKPQGEEQGGGSVAAPVFAKIAAGAMRILNVPPDNLAGEKQLSMAVTVNSESSWGAL